MKQVRTAELMDDPNLDPQVHARALAGLARLNMLSGGAKPLWDEILKVANLSKEVGQSSSSSANSITPITLLDIASGGGDILLDLAKRARTSGLDLRITGSDFSSTAVDIASKKFAGEFPNVNFIAIDALNDQFPSHFDIVSTSLFTHHLDGAQVTLLLQKMSEAARKCVIVSDLDRSSLNYLLVWIATRVATRSPIVHYDGPVSVKAAYTSEEFLRIAELAGLKNASAKPAFPCRFLFTSWKDGPN